MNDVQLSLKRYAVVVALAVLSGLAGGLLGARLQQSSLPVTGNQARPPGPLYSAGVIEASDIRLVGKDGKIRARLICDEDDSPRFALIEPGEKNMILLTSKSEKCGMTVGHGGVDRVELLCHEDGAVRLGLYDVAGKNTVGLFATNASCGMGIVLEGRPNAILATEGGGTFFSIMDGKARPRIRLSYEDGNGGCIELIDSEKRKRGQIAISDDGRTVIQLGDRDGKLIWHAGE